MRIIRRLRSWLKLKKRVKGDSRNSSNSGSPRRKRSQSLAESAIPSYASRHAQFFTTGSNSQFDLVFNPAIATDDTASDITPRDAGPTLGRRELGMLRQKHSSQSIRIVPPSPRRPHAADDHESSALFAEKVPSATTAIPPPLVPFSALVHPKSTTPLTTPHSSSQQLSPAFSDIQALSDLQLNSSVSNQGDPSLDITPDRLADLRRASGVNTVLKIYDNAGAIASREFDNGPPTFSSNGNQSPSSVARVDAGPRTPSSPNRRRLTNPERLKSSQVAPFPFAAQSGSAREHLGIPVAPGPNAGDATLGSTDISLTSSTSASFLHSSSERELATSEISTAAHVNLAHVQHAKMMSKDLVNLPNATVPSHLHDAGSGRPSALKPNSLKKIMSINALDNELENQERSRQGGSLPSTPTWGPDHQSFPRFSTPTNAQPLLPSSTPVQGDFTRPIAPRSVAHSSLGLSSSHPALAPPPKHRKAPPTRLRRPKTADDAAALSPPPWRSVSSFGGKDDITNVKDMGGGVSVVRIPAAQRSRRPATSAGIVSPRAGGESFSRSTRREEPIQESQSQLVASTPIPESDASFYSCLTTPRNGQESALASTTSLVSSARGMNSKDSIHVLSRRRSIRSRLTIPGEDENTPLRRKHSHGRSPVIRKSISEGAFQTPEKDAAGSERKVKRFGSLRKVGTVPLKKPAGDQAGEGTRRHRRKKRTHNRPRLSFVLATDVELGSSPRQSYLGVRRVSSISSLGSASDDDVEKEGNDFSDSRSTFGKYGSGDGAGSDEEPTTESRTNSTVEDVVEATTPSRSAMDLSAELSEETKQMMTNIRERKGKKSTSSGLRAAMTQRGDAFLAIAD